MAPRVRGLIAPVLIVLFVSLPGAVSARGRRGADVIISMKNRLLVSGELIAVRQDSLLLVNRVGQDASVKFTEISSVKVLKKAHGGTGRNDHLRWPIGIRGQQGQEAAPRHGQDAHGAMICH